MNHYTIILGGFPPIKMMIPDSTKTIEPENEPEERSEMIDHLFEVEKAKTEDPF